VRARVLSKWRGVESDLSAEIQTWRKVKKTLRHVGQF